MTTQKILYLGGGKCESHSIACSAYEEEVKGSLSLTFQIIHIEQESNSTDYITIYNIYIDNESVINEIWKLKNNIVPKPLQPSYEMIHQIHTNLKFIQSKTKWFWVKSHQTGCTNDIWVNNTVDHYSNKIR